MEKRYTTYLGELEKIIDSGKLNEEHEYYELYMYIKQLYKPLIIKQLIEKKINTIINTIGNKYIEEKQNIPKNIESVPIPKINQGIERIKSEKSEKLVRINNIEQTKKYIIETIYEEILNALNQTESQYEKSAKQNLNKLISDCEVALTGIRYHGMRFIEEDKINNELIKDFTEKLNDDDFFSLYQLEKDETSKIEMIIEEKQINESLTNSKIIVTEFIINKIINKIQRIDEEIEQQLDQNTRLFLQRENILTEEKGQIHINITTERLREIKISEKELFELLNVRCRLNDIKEKLENGKEIKYEVCEKDKKILKRIMKDIELSEIELSSLELELKIIYKQFKQAKKEELKRIRSEISQLEENKKTIMTQTIRELFQDQSNNLELLCRPSSPQILSAKGAIYIVNTLTYLGKKRNEELINFLTNEKVAKLSSREENIIENITSRWINNYIEHPAQEQPELSQLEDAHQLIKRRKIMSVMDNSEYQQIFIDLIKYIYFNSEEMIELNNESKFIYKSWYKTIYDKCIRLYIKDKIKEIRENFKNRYKEEIETKKERAKLGYNSTLVTMYESEKEQIEEIQATIEFIEKLPDEELMQKVIESISNQENIEQLIEERKRREQEKFSTLSYKGQNAVVDSVLNREILEKIFKELEDPQLTKIAVKVSKTLSTNEEFKKLKEAKDNATEIIIYFIAQIYIEKIEKIKAEIKEQLKKLKKAKYKEDINKEQINLVRLKTKIDDELKKKLITNSTRERLRNIKSMIEATINHEQQLEQMQTSIRGLELTEETINIYNETHVSNEIESKRKDTLHQTGVIINIQNQEIELFIERFVKELEEKARKKSEKIKELATREELEKIKQIAEIIGMSERIIIDLLKDKDNLYTCLYTYVQGERTLEIINTPTVAYKVMNDLDTNATQTSNQIQTQIKRQYRISETREDTRSKQVMKRKNLKIPPKN